MSNPPSRGSGQGGGNNKTIGKHEVPMLNVEEMDKENEEEGGNGPVMLIVNKQLARTAAADQLAHSRSFPASLVSSPVSTPGTQRRQLPPSGIKLPVPPPSLLNGLPNVQKSASSASLNLHAVTAGVSPSAGKSDCLRETVTVPNAGEMLAAARAELIGGGIGGGKLNPGIGRPSKPLTRLPPLQLPKGPRIEADKGEREKAEEEREKRAEGKEEAAGGRIATMATESMPQLKPMDLSKLPSPQPSSPLPIPQMDQSTAAAANSVPQTPQPPAASASPSPLPPPARVPPLQHSVPNEVPIHQHNPRRRPSSAGQLNGRADVALALTAHKPLPAISEPVTIKKGHRPISSMKKWHGSKPRSWRLALKCAIVTLFLSIPVIIFVLMMFFSDGFAPASSSKGNSSASSIPPPSDAGSPSPLGGPLTTTPGPIGPTAVNIVGGAIFAPISMQNETAATIGGS